MRRQVRNGLVATALVAVVAVPGGWYLTGPHTAAALSSAGSASHSPVTSAASSGASSIGTPAPVPTQTAHPAAHAAVTPKATARPVTASKPSPKPVFRFPVPVIVGNAQQVITVSAYGSYATVEAWQLRSGGWHLVAATRAARVGANGVVAAASRRQGTYTTPAGTFTLTQAFGIAANPGTSMPYHQVTSDDWWVEDNNSAYYNQMRTASQGGFDTSLPPSATNSSEHLVTYPTEYRYVVVIDFNRWPAVRYRGAGIFLHVNGSGATAGCVSVPLATMLTLIDWLDPAQHPRIAIA